MNKEYYSNKEFYASNKAPKVSWKPRILILFPIILILIVILILLNRSDSKSIIVDFFSTENEAQESLVNLQEYFKNDDELLKLQRTNKLEFKVSKSEKYYETIIQPITSTVVLEEILNRLALKYKNMYVSNIKKEAISKILPTKVIKKEVIALPKVIEEKKLEEKIMEFKSGKIEKQITTSNKSYPRIIIIGSFFKDSQAQEFLVKLKKNFENNDNLLKLQKKHKLELKVKKLEKYYAAVIEPESVILQEVMDALRVKYKDAYVRNARVLVNTAIVPK